MRRSPKKRGTPGPGLPRDSEQSGAGAPARRATGSMPQFGEFHGPPAVSGLLLLAVLIVFGQTIGHGFINFDDDSYVFENGQVNGGLTTAGIAWAITAFHSENWHPLTWISHMLDCQLYGLNPGGHHLSNLLLHAATAILLFLVLRRMTGRLWPSAWVAAIFAIHPLRVESVAWAAERKDVLSGLFFMLTLWFYARYAERAASRGRYWPVVASFALGLTAKPMLVTLPFVLLLLDYWPLGRIGGGGRGQGAGSREQGGRQKMRDESQISNLRFQLSNFKSQISSSILLPSARLIVEKIPLFALAAASCLVTLAAQRTAIRSWEQLSIAARAANAAVAYVAYLGKMLYPADLAIFYQIGSSPPPAGRVIVAVILLLAISTAAFAARRKCPYLLFGWLWYLGTLVPVIGLVQVGFQAMADRYSYLTQIGLYTAFAWGAADLARPWRYRGWALAVVSTVLLAGLMVCAWQQTRHWRDSEALWTHALGCNPQNPLAHSNLGNALARRGLVVEAIAQYRTALEIKPDDAMTHVNLGVALAGRREFDEAIVEYGKALDIKPDFAAAHNNLGIALAARGQVDEAIDHYHKALDIEPNYAMAHNNLGLALYGRKEIDEAIVHFRKALAIMPAYAKAHISLGDALAKHGSHGEALEHYRKALDLASAQNDRALADSIRARLKGIQP